MDWQRSQNIILKICCVFALLHVCGAVYEPSYWSRGKQRGADERVHRHRISRQISRKRSFTEAQKQAVQNQVMCNTINMLKESEHQSTMINDKQELLEELEERIRSEGEILSENRRANTRILRLYNNDREECWADMKEMLVQCNSCIATKCLKYHKENCDKPVTEENVSCEPNSPCFTTSEEYKPTTHPHTVKTTKPAERAENNGKNGSFVPSRNQKIVISVNGNTVKNIDEALQLVKHEIQESITAPCEPSLRFSQFGSVTTSSRVWNKTDQPKEVKFELNEMNNGYRNGGNSKETPTSSTFLEPQLVTSQYFPPSSGDFGPITQMGCNMTPEEAAGLETVHDSFISKPCTRRIWPHIPAENAYGVNAYAQQISVTRTNPRKLTTDSRRKPCNGSCQTFQTVRRHDHGGENILNELHSQIDRLFGNSSVSTDENGFVYSSDVRASPNGKTYTYRVTTNSQDKVTMDDIINIVNLRNQNLGVGGLRRRSRNFKEHLVRRRRYNPQQNDGIASKCLLEQIQNQAAKRPSQSEEYGAEDLPLENHGTACRSLTAKYGNYYAYSIIQNMVLQLEEKMRSHNKRCQLDDRCGKTEVYININSQNSNCNGGNFTCKSSSADKNEIEESRSHESSEILSTTDAITTNEPSTQENPSYTEDAAYTDVPEYTETSTQMWNSLATEITITSMHNTAGFDKTTSAPTTESNHYDPISLTTTESEATTSISDYDSLGLWASYWSTWSTCDTPCSSNGNPGTQSRKRECLKPDGTSAQIGEGSCNPGSDVSYRPCVPAPPPCSKWAEWGFWTECSATCGPGKRLRQRSCMYGAICDGNKTAYKYCVNEVRPSCPSWSIWKTDTPCSVTCGNGYGSKYRTCLNGKIGDPGCEGDAYIQSVCHTGKACPTWSEWNSWSECGVTCGQSHTFRSRTCASGRAGDIGCEGNSFENKVCFAQNRRCPAWGPWSHFTPCSATCGDGIHTRTRMCRNGSQGDIGCEGPKELKQSCYARQKVCPAWSNWTKWTSCSVTCGDGIQSKSRRCTNGRSGNHGCIGSDMETRECYGFKRECEYWGPWQSWHPCSVTCGKGTTKRQRPCINGNPGDKGCHGSALSLDKCEMSSCEVFVEYDNQDHSPLDFSEICPNSKEEVIYEKEIVVKYIEQGEKPSKLIGGLEGGLEGKTVSNLLNNGKNIKVSSCQDISYAESEACTNMFATGCTSCDTSVKTVCPENFQYLQQLDQLRKDIANNHKRIEHYTIQMERVNAAIITLHDTVKNEYSWVNTITQQMINNEEPDDFMNPCDVIEVTVKTEFNEAIINIQAQMKISPFAEINIDLPIDGDCCNTKNAMAETRKKLGKVLIDHIKRVVRRNYR